MSVRGVTHRFLRKNIPCPYHPCDGVFTYVWLIFMVNVGKYTIDWFYGMVFPHSGKDQQDLRWHLVLSIRVLREPNVACHWLTRLCNIFVLNLGFTWIWMFECFILFLNVGLILIWFGLFFGRDMWIQKNPAVFLSRRSLSEWVPR